MKNLFCSLVLMTVPISCEIALATPNDFNVSGLEARAGQFIQANGSLTAAGLFWAPELRFAKSLYLGARAGAWILKTGSGSPAFTPSVQLAPRFDLFDSGFSLTLLVGGGYALVLDSTFLETGGSLTLEWDLPLSISAIGLHYAVVNANIQSNYIGGLALWRW